MAIALFDSTAKALRAACSSAALGYVFQDARLFPHLNVRENLTFGARYAPASATGASLDDVIDLLGLCCAAQPRARHPVGR